MNLTLPSFARRAATVTLLVALGTTGVSAGPTAYDADVLIQAGHEGRPDCNVESAALCNNTGARGEIELTPVVADRVAKILRAAGISVIPGGSPGMENAVRAGLEVRLRARQLHAEPAGLLRLQTCRGRRRCAGDRGRRTELPGSSRVAQRTLVLGGCFTRLLYRAPFTQL